MLTSGFTNNGPFGLWSITQNTQKAAFLFTVKCQRLRNDVFTLPDTDSETDSYTDSYNMQKSYTGTEAGTKAQ